MAKYETYSKHFASIRSAKEDSPTGKASASQAPNARNADSRRQGSRASREGPHTLDNSKQPRRVHTPAGPRPNHHTQKELDEYHREYHRERNFHRRKQSLRDGQQKPSTVLRGLYDTGGPEHQAFKFAIEYGKQAGVIQTKIWEAYHKALHASKDYHQDRRN